MAIDLPAAAAAWPTPRAIDGEKGQRTEKGLAAEIARKGHLDELPSVASLSAWATPKIASGDYQYGLNHEKILNLQGQAQLTAFGETPIGYLLGPNGWEIVPASGQLNASHSRWLMGLPEEWDQAALAAFRSLKKRKRGSGASVVTETA
jgi:hypothetical protein